MTLDLEDSSAPLAMEALCDEDGRPYTPQLLRWNAYNDPEYAFILAQDCARGDTWVFGDDELIVPAVYLVPDPENWPEDQLTIRDADDYSPRLEQGPAVIVDDSGAHRSQKAAEFLTALVGEFRPAIVIIDNFEAFRTLDGPQTAEEVDACAKALGVLIIGMDHKTGHPFENEMN